MNIGRRLEQMRERLERSKPARMTVISSDGSVTVTDPVGALAIVRDSMTRENVVSITADRPEYRAAAAIWTIVCHPAPDRRITDFG